MNAEARARERQRVAEVAMLRSELQKHPDDAERWAKLGKASLYAATACGCHCSLGLVQHSQGNHADALQSFTRAAQHGACEYRLAEELLELGELEQSNVLVRARLAQTSVRPGNFDKLYVLHALELQIALQRGDLTQAHAARERLAEYAIGLSPEIALNWGTTYAVSRPPQPTGAKQLLNRFVQSSCDDSQPANDCDHCAVARDLLVHLAATNP
jgi:hypothetical protein